MKYINEESSRYAQKLEKLICDLPKAAGIVCASVRAVPADNGAAKSYDVFLGTTQEIGDGVKDALVRTLAGDVKVNVSALVVKPGKAA